jgi:hypothetical protein
MDQLQIWRRFEAPSMLLSLLLLLLLLLVVVVVVLVLLNHETRQSYASILTVNCNSVITLVLVRREGTVKP